MSAVQILVADAGRARFLSLEAPPETESRRRLVERDDLLNPEGRLTDSEVYSDSRPGLRHADVGGPGHGLDDHRSGHFAEVDRRFARRIAEEAVRRCRDEEARRLVVVAGPHMLGLLRDSLAPIEHLPVRVVEIPKDLSRLPLNALLSALDAEEALPQGR